MNQNCSFDYFDYYVSKTILVIRIEKQVYEPMFHDLGACLPQGMLVSSYLFNYDRQQGHWT